MPRVASLYLPEFAIERLRRLDRGRQAPAPPPPERPTAPPPGDAPPTATTGWRPGARWARSDGGRGPDLQSVGAERASGERKDAIAAARSGDWPEAERLWAERRTARRAAKAAAIEAQIATLPRHQQPPIRELGRRSEGLPHPFKAMPSDEAGAPRDSWQASLPSPLDRLAIGDDYPKTEFDRPGRKAFGRDDDTARLPGSNSGFIAVPKGAVASPAGRKRPSTLELCGYDLDNAFWQSGHAIAGEIRDNLLVPANAGTPLPSSQQEKRGPRLRGDNEAPLVTARRDGNRILVDAACPAARALGLVPGMALTAARALVPGLDVRDADPDGDAADLARLALFAARRWTPLVAAERDGLRLELAGAAHLHGGEAAFCARLLRFLARLGLTARVAIADSHGASHALARHGLAAVILCPPGAHADAIAPLPLAGLRLEPRAAEALRRLGVDTIAAVMAMPRAPLARRFGDAALARLDQALGRRPEPFEPVVPQAAPAASCRFMEPIGTAESIAAAIRHLLAALVVELGERGLGACRLLLACTRVDDHIESVTIGVARPSRDPAHLARLLCAKIEKIDPGFGIERLRLTAIRCDPLAAVAVAHPLSGAPPPPDLAALVDLLAVRLGSRRLYRAGAIESDVPERSVARAGPLAPALPAHPEWPRPLKLLDPPEPVDHVVSLLPDGPPQRFEWRGRLIAVRAADGPERIHGEWWRRPAEADAVRDYFQVEDDAGHRYWLFRRGDGLDPRTGDMSWRLHGLFG